MSGIYKATVYPESPVNRVDLTFKAHNDRYVVGAEFSQPQHDDILRFRIDGLNIKTLKVDGVESKYLRGDKDNGNKIKTLETHFDIGQAHQILTYLQRLLGKEVSQAPTAYHKI